MRHLFELSAETVRIIGLFKEMKIDETISFATASKRTGVVITSTTSAYHSARRIALRDDGIVIEGVRGVGFARLNGSGMVGKGYRTMAAIRRASRRGAAVTEVAIRQNLTQSEMVAATEQFSRFRILETTARMSAPRSNKDEIEDPPKAAHVDTRDALRNAR